MILTGLELIHVPVDSSPAVKLGEGWLFVRLRTDVGLVGVGEASQAGNGMVRAYLAERLAPVLRGRDPTGIEPLVGELLSMASVHLAATIPTFLALEYPWGEADWRGRLLAPAEVVLSGEIEVPDRPGLGFALDDGFLGERDCRVEPL